MLNKSGRGADELCGRIGLLEHGEEGISIVGRGGIIVPGVAGMVVKCVCLFFGGPHVVEVGAFGLLERVGNGRHMQTLLNQIRQSMPQKSTVQNEDAILAHSCPKSGFSQ